MTAATAQSLRVAVQDVRLAFSKTGCITSAVLVLAGAGLDLAVYPDKATTFLLVRALVVLTLFAPQGLMGEIRRRIWRGLP